MEVIDLAIGNSVLLVQGHHHHHQVKSTFLESENFFLKVYFTYWKAKMTQKDKKGSLFHWITLRHSCNGWGCAKPKLETWDFPGLTNTRVILCCLSGELAGNLIRSGTAESHTCILIQRHETLVCRSWLNVLRPKTGVSRKHF